MGRKVIAFWLSLTMVLGLIVVLDVIVDFTPPVKGGIVRYVNETGTGGAFTKIQDAINASSDGDTVFVYGGTYYEDVKVNRSINLTGEDMDTTVINGSGNGYPVFVNANWTNVTGFTITGSGSVSGDAGILLYYVENCIVENNNISMNMDGIYLYFSSYNNISSNMVSFNDGYGIDFYSSMNNSVMHTDVLSNGFSGIYLRASSNNSITENNVNYNSQVGIILQESHNNIVIGNDLSNNNDGLTLEGFSDDNTIMYNNASFNGGFGYHVNSNNTFVRNNAMNNENGIYLGTIRKGNFSENKIYSNNKTGIYGTSATNGTIYNNSIYDNGYYGIYFWTSYDITITGNNISSNTRGIYLLDSSDFKVTNNDIYENTHGCFLSSSPNNTFQYNNIDLNDLCGMYLDNSSYNTISDNSVILNGDCGIRLVDSTMVNITHNIVTDSEYGIYLSTSSKNTVTYNNVSSNNMTGISLLDFSSDNTITNNHVSENDVGISFISSSSNNTISQNNFIFNSNWGVYITSSSNNNIFHNYIISNENQAFDDTIDGNNWDVGYPGGGNFWSDYDGFDDFSGPGQDIPGSDKIGDDPYVIDTDSQDNYPLMEPTPDTIAPRIVLISHQNNSVIKPGVTLDYNIIDGNLDFVGYSVDGALEGTFSAPYDISTSTWTQGSHSVFIRAVDTEGNEARELFFFIADSEAPQIQLNNPANNSVIQRGTQLNYSIIDPNLDLVNYSFDGGDEFTLSSPFNINTSHLPDGDHEVLIRAWDQVGNLESKSYRFVIDSTPANITDVSVTLFPEEEVTFSNISANITDKNEISEVWINITDPHDNNLGNFSMEYDLQNNKYFLNRSYDVVGTYEMVIWALDEAGNWISSSGTFKIILRPEAPTNLSVISGDSYNYLTWDAPSSDGGAPITNYRIYRGETSGGEIYIAESGNFLFYNDTQLQNGVTYYYKVKAKNIAGGGALSEGTSGTPFASPDSGDSPDSDEGPCWWPWILIFFLILAILIIIILIMRSKREKEEEGREEEF